ncbi:MAG TPA: TIGR03560 family F420-dependent LLM class oxidoreductase [Acidimicrobiia bacterium]|nr:TIGR03560 family F420-dependent LLM class oxidoreductase [Acidimicrobiia bacterium]
MRFGLDVAQQRLPWPEIAARTRFAEDLGFDGAWGFDHFQPMYGEGPGECFEGYATLAALAALTERVRLGLLVTGITYRHPSVLAAQAITIDHVSAGRLELAVGSAWFDKEHRELGIPFPPTRDRVDMLDEAVELMIGLMTTDGYSFSGRHFELRDATLLPRPVQQPHVPIWIGGTGERRTLPLVARFGDAWHGFGGVAQLLPKSRRIDELAEAAGRDPASILRTASISLDPPVDAVRRTVEEWRDAGFGYLIAGWPGEGRPKVEQFAAEVLPAFREE